MNRRQFLLTAPALATPFAFAPNSPAGAVGRELPFRQIHLDFHNSELIPDIAADFDAREFAATLQSARVNSINLFAKCHHGYAYYNTRIATRHPSLKIDLLGEMIRECKNKGIATVYYYTLVWDVLQARKHPDWLMVNAAGQPFSGMPQTNWPWLCMTSPYLDHCAEENREIVENYDVDGVWFDILFHPEGGCHCQWCRADRKKLGLDESMPDIFRHEKIVAKRVEQRLNDVVLARRPKATTFYNARVVIGLRDEVPYYTHIEIESLPTGGWGYSHFQNRVRYMRTLDRQVVGMTGRFHRSWADFGGFKNQAAIDYECLNFVANGAKISIGDQLHPRGRLDPVTYGRIGKAFRKVEALEPWARGTRGVADIGVISAAAADPDMSYKKMPATDTGFTNMLVELHQQFDILDFEADLARYKVIIVPDEIPADPKLCANLRRYMSGGGALLVSSQSLVQDGKFALEGLGVKYTGPAKYKGEYLLLKPDAFPDIDDTAYFLYQPGVAISAEPGTEVLATYGHPYFDRSPEHYSSHRQTPLGRRTEEPLITRRGNIVYVANPFFRSYAMDGYGIQKLIVGKLLQDLLPNPAVIARNLPTTAQITVLTQQDNPHRRIVHVLHYPLTRRAPDIDIIEEPGLLENVTIRLRTAERPSRVALVPQNKEIAFHHQNGYATCRLDKVVGHQAIVFD